MMQSAGIPNQCACQELAILPRNNHEIEWPRPQPGHQAMPSALSGHKLKWIGPAGLVTASAIKAAIQNINSKNLEKKDLINFFGFAHEQ